ncbi:MAG: energy-coupling factor transporter transmembrane protein EcfT [Desulfamplus sp.]|nr:energy-coupling factor transporter transmembrane protein EcfT [Desulfamplus sp.]
MAKATQFSYRPGNFVLYKLDVRCKIICICLLSIMMTMANFSHLSLISAILLWLLYRSGINFCVLIWELKYFFLILLFVFTIRSLVTPGEPIPILKILGIDFFEKTNIGMLNHITITIEGVIDGGKVAWRFLVIMIMGLLFSCSTQTSSLKVAVAWFLKPFPLIPEKRVGVMVSLFVRFLPLILEKAHEVSDAQKSRCAHLQKNPVKRIKNITIPLLTKVFSCADTLAIAMASRCYNEDRTEQKILKSGYEFYFYAGTVALYAFILFYRAPLFLH